MRTAEAIIADFKSVLYWSQPNIKFNEMNALISELEAALSPVEVIEEPIAETEQIVLIKNEEGIFEEVTVNEEPVVAKKTTRKK